MIFYFSGTGNSKWVAQEIAKLTDDETQNIASFAQDGPNSVFLGDGARVGIVFPIYAWGAPLIVERFCKQLKLPEHAYAYALCTCGDEAGLGMRRLQKVFAFHSAFSVTMPNNYIVGFDTDSSDLEEKKISDAREKLADVARVINARESVYDVREGVGAGMKTALVFPLFNTFGRATKHFSVDQNCNGCGLCARICPIGAIKMETGHPVWLKKHCTQCLGCIHRCPQRAIQHGAATAKRGRYYMKEAFKD